MLRAVGIDLGTNKSVVAVLRRGEPEALLSPEGSPFTPSLLALGPGEELFSGQAAEERLLAVPGSPAVRCKQWLGRQEPLSLGSLHYSPGELAAAFLFRLRRLAEEALGEPVGRAVLAVPLAFGQAQLASLRAAAHLAGLQVLRLVQSPAAAALAYALAHPEAEPQTLLAFDLGGSFLDVSLLRRFPGALTVLGQTGEGWLGGEDLTDTIVAYLIRCLQGERGVLLDEDQAARSELRQRLRPLAEHARRALSIVERVAIDIPTEVAGPAAAMRVALSREEYEELIRPRLEEALAVADRALAAAGLLQAGVDSILPLGGAAQTPALVALLAQRFHAAPQVADASPWLAPALGAAVLTGLVAEVTCPTCELRNPVQARRCRRCRSSLAGEDRLACPRCSLPNDPRRQVCWKCGASLRRALLARRRPARRRPCPHCSALVPAGRAVCPACHALLAAPGPHGLRCRHCGIQLSPGLATCPTCGDLVAPFLGLTSTLGLGLELPGGELDTILPQGTALPTARPVCRELRTLSAGQTSLEVAVYEGSRPLAHDNPICARLQLTLPEGLPAGTPIRLAFSLDEDGLLAATATGPTGDLPVRLP